MELSIKLCIILLAEGIKSFYDSFFCFEEMIINTGLEWNEQCR